MKRLLVLYALLLSFTASSQYLISTITDIWELSLSHAADCNIYRQKMVQAQQEVLQSKSSLYPNIGFRLNGQVNFDLPETPVPGELFGKPNETIPLAFGKKFQYSGGFTVSKKLVDWQTHFQIKIAALNKELLLAEQTFFIQTLKEELAVVYYLALTSKLCAKSLQTDAMLSDTILQITNDRYKQGLVDESILNQAIIKRNQVLQQQQRMNQQLYQTIQQLKELIGLGKPDSIDLIENLEREEPGDAMCLKPNHSFIKLYEIQHKLTSLELKRSFGNYLPKLELYSFWGYRQYQDKLSFSVNSNQMQPENYLGISLSVPLFTGFSTSARYNSAIIGHTISKLYLDDAERKASLQDESFAYDLILTNQMLVTVKQSFALSLKNLQLAKEKYNIGLIDLEAYIKVFDLHLEIENQYFEALSNHLILKAKALARE